MVGGRVRRPALPHVLVAEAVLGARPHGRRARGRDRHRRAGHPSLLPRELRDPGAADRALRAQADPARDHHHRRAARARRAEPLGTGAGPLLPHPQGRAARPRVATLRGVDLRHSPRPVAVAIGHPQGRALGRLRCLEGSPPRGLDGEGRLAIHHEERHPVQPAPRRRATGRSAASLYAPDAARRGGAGGPLGRLRQARMRAPRHPERNA